LKPDEIVFAPKAERQIKKLTRDQQRIVFGTLADWKSGATSPSIEKIKSQPDFFRLRAGDFRMIYCLLTHARVLILLVKDRKDAYKNLGDLTPILRAAKKSLGIALSQNR